MSHLKLVPTPEESFHQWPHSNIKENPLVADTGKVGAIISQYLAWPDYTEAMMKVAGEATWTKVILTVDQEEAEPIDLRISGSPEHYRKPNTGEEAEFRISVFGMCYGFKSKITWVATSNVGFDFTISVPDQLTRFLSRSLPRTSLKFEEQFALKWRARSGVVSELIVTEMSVVSVKVNATSVIESGFGALVIGEFEIPSELVNRNSSTQDLFVKLHFETGAQYGKYFEVYLKYAYPSLRSRAHFERDPNPALYLETGYAKKYSSESTRSEFIKDLEQSWEIVKTVQHEFAADVVALDKKGAPTGCSSLAQAFTTASGVPIWVFHALCSLTDPDLLSESGQLYLWRAEYLAGRKEELVVAGWFDGNSRWLERIYVKFATVCADMKLIPVSIYQIMVESKLSSSDVQISYFGRAEFQRTNAIFGDCIAGIGVRYFNPANFLDHAFTLNHNESPQNIITTGQSASQRQNVTSFVATLPGKEASPGNNVAATHFNAGNRQFTFNKADLPYFMSSVVHSIAITKRKYLDVS